MSLIETKEVKFYSSTDDFPQVGNELCVADGKVYAVSGGFREVIGGGSGAAGFVIENLLNREYVSAIARSALTGGVVTNDDLADAVDITCPAGGRAFLTLFSTAYTFLAGNIYCLSFRVESFSKPTSAGNFLETVSAATLDFGNVALPLSAMSVDGTYAVIFQPTTSQVISFRLGYGLGGAITGNAACRLSEIMCVNLTESSTHLPPPVYCEGYKQVYANVNYQGSLANQTSGLLTATREFVSETQKSIAIFGDSWVNDLIDYPTKLQLLNNPRIPVWYQREISNGVTTGGTRPSVFLATFETKLQKLIDRNTRPKFVLIQSSMNSINVTEQSVQQSNIALDCDRIEQCAIFAKQNGITPILTLTQPCKLGIVTWVSDNKYHSALLQDQLIRSIASRTGALVFDFKHSIGDPVDKFAMDAAYNGDGLHPNEAGYIKIAADLQKLIQSN